MRKQHTPLANIRRARTLNQQQMAELLNISQQTYSKYESGRLLPPAHTRTRIAAILGSPESSLWPELEALAS